MDSAQFKVGLNIDTEVIGVCFELDKTEFTFELKKDGLINLDDKIKTAIIYNMEDITPKFDISTNLQLSMNIPIAPVILECKFSVNAELFNGSSLLSNSEEDENEKIFKTVITSAGKIDINLANLNATAEYYAQCNISDTGSITDFIKNIVINIGDFANSDIIKKLIPAKDPNATPQCAQLTFENKNQANDFKKYGGLYCANYMKKDESLISRALPTIIAQVIDPIKSDDKIKVLCVAPSPLYNTGKTLKNKETDFNEKFDAFLKELQKSEKEYNLIKDFKVNKVVVEKDISIDPESISVSLKNIDKAAFVPTKFTFEVNNRHSQSIQCGYNPVLTTETSKWKQLLPMPIILSPNEKKEINIAPDPTKIISGENEFYSLYLKCENLPNFFFKYETTGAMNKYSYYNSKIDISQLIEEITETTINCNEKKNALNPRCLSTNFISIIDQLKTGIPQNIADLEEAAKKFASSSLDVKLKVLIDIQNELKNIINQASGDIKSIIENSMKLLKFLTHLDCSIYASGSTNIKSETIEGKLYIKCREGKTNILDTIINLIKNVLTCENIENLINQQMLLQSTNVINDLEETIKYIFLFINELSNNQEAISNSTIEFVFDLIECLENNFDKIWEKLESILSNTYIKEAIEAIKKDLINILLQTIQNIAKIIHFEEIDGKFGLNITDTGIILEANIKIIYDQLLKFAKKLIEFGPSNYTFSGSMISNIEIKDESKQASIDVDTQQKIITVKSKDILIITNSNLLYEDNNIYALQTLVFDSPIVSIKTSGGAEGKSDALNLFISITLTDKNGNEISINDIDEKLRPQILYLKNKYQDLQQCFYYDNNKQNLINEGINSIEKFIYEGKEYFKCISSHVSEFTAGTAPGVKSPEQDEGSNTGLVVGVIISCVVVIAAIIFIVIYFKKRKADSFYGKSNDNNVKLVNV